MLNMDPEQLGELLSAYLDGELRERDVQTVEKLLCDNADVREQLDALRQTVSRVQSLPRHAPPPELAQDLLAQLERRDLLDDIESVNPVKPVRGFPWVAVLSAAAAIGMVAMVGFRQFGAWSADRLPTSVLVADARTDDSIGTVAKRELDQVSEEAAAPDRQALQVKLDEGTTTEDVRAHSFAAETVRLTVGMTHSGGAADAMNRIVTHLANAEILNVSDARRRALSTSSGAFFLPGVRGVNFEDAQSQQVLVRIPSAALAELLDVVETQSSDTASVKLLAGSLQFDGLDNARSTLGRQGTQLAVASEKDARSQRSARRRGRRANHKASRTPTRNDRESAQLQDSNFVDLMETLGVPKTALDEANPSLAAVPGERIVGGNAPSPELTESATSSTSAKKTLPTKAKAIANQPMTVVPEGSAANRSVSVPAGLVKSAAGSDEFVTLVLEFREPPSSSTPPRHATSSRNRTKKPPRVSRPSTSQSQ